MSGLVRLTLPGRTDTPLGGVRLSGPGPSGSGPGPGPGLDRVRASRVTDTVAILGSSQPNERGGVPTLGSSINITRAGH
jgi:hypothetical protein